MGVKSATPVQQRLRPFRPQDAAVIAGWVESPRDLFWLAPATPPPLTAQKVQGWTTSRDHPLVYCTAKDSEPIGYAELNFMPRTGRDLWIGHLIIPRRLRGQGLGHALTLDLLNRAFVHLHARRVSLVVFPENEAAVHCYLKCGMAKDGIQVKSFAHLEGQHTMLRMAISRRHYQRYHGLTERTR